EDIMGMAVSVVVAAAEPAEEAFDELFAWLRWVDEVFSTYRESSEISRLADGALTLAECSLAVAEILERCEALRKTTDGYFDANASGRLDPSGLVKGWAVENGSSILFDAGFVDHC